jgi:hypothetical protein
VLAKAVPGCVREEFSRFTRSLFFSVVYVLILPKKDVFACEGKENGPSVVPGSVEELQKLAVQAPVGMIDRTEVNLNVRNSLAVSKDHVQVVWSGLENALRASAKQLFPTLDATLKAELHNILIYHPGSFFDWHADSKKKHVNHILTLSVVVQGAERGGDLIFRHDACEKSPNMNILKYKPDFQDWIWSDQRPGAWACWFSSQRHAVRLVTKGTRIVAIYNVILEQVVPVPRLWLKDESCPLSSLGRDVGTLMARYLDVCSLARLSRTCQAFYKWFGGEVLLAHALERSTPMLKEILRQKGFCRYGFVLKNQYASDQRNGVTPEHLYGRDSSVYAAFARAFSGYRVYTRECYVEASFSESGSNRRNVTSARVFQSLKSGVTHTQNQDSSEAMNRDRPWCHVSVIPVLDVWKSLVPWGWSSMTPHINFEDEDDISLLPFFHSLWLNTSESLLDVASAVEADATVSSWANDGRDGQSWYRATVLFVNLLNEPAPPADDGVLTSDFFSTEPLEFSRRNTPFSWPSWWRREESDEVERKEKRRAREAIRNRVRR